MKLPAVLSLFRPFHPTLGLLLFCLACAPAAPRTASVTSLAPAPETGPALLEEGKVVERVLGGGERHEHRIAVEAGWYVRLEIEQVGMDVAASLLSPDGAVLFSADDPDGLLDEEALAVIAPTSGELRLVVTPHDTQASPGPYRVTVVARRPAAPGDAERAAAQRAQAEAGFRLGPKEERERRQAIPLLEEAVRLWGLAGEPEEQVKVLNELGVLQCSLSEMKGALATFQSALSLSQATGNRTGEAFGHSNLAGMSGFLEDSQRIEHYQRALVLFEELGDASQRGRVLYSIGILHRDRGSLDEALHYLNAALPLRQAARDLGGELNTLLALAIVHQARGNVEQASECLNRARELSRSVGWAGQASALAVMSRFHRYRGELGEALASQQQVRESYRRLGDTTYEARALHHLGALYLDLGDLEGARRSYEEGIDLVRGKDPVGESHFLNSLGWVLYLQGDSAAALRHFESALALARQKELPAGVAQALGRTGAVYVALGRAREGLNLLREGLILDEKHGDRSAQAKNLLEIGKAWQTLGDLAQAAASFGNAFDLGRRVGNTGLQATCLYHWAALDRQRGDLHQALSRIEQALGIIESVRSRVSSEKLRTTYLASKRSWYELYIDLRMRLEEKEPGQGHAALALAASERARSRGLLDLIAEGRIDVQEGIAPELKRRETELGLRLSWIQEKLDEELMKDPESRRATELNAQLDQVIREMQQLEDEIRLWHPRYAEVRYPTPLRLEEVQSLLDERTALLEYFVGRESAFLFAVTRDGLSVHRLPAAEMLETRVESLRATLERSGPLTLGRFRKEAGALYDLLLRPARLEGKPNLLISPDGPLSLIPFEVLLTDAARGSFYRELAYLLRSHSISYIPSASVLHGLRELRPAPPAEAPAPRELIAFGDPIYPEFPAGLAQAEPVRASMSSRTVPRLPGSEREVKAIADLYPESEVALYLRENATEENVKANPLLQTARRIHFATHGLLDEARPQLSGLMLTRNPAFPEGDGVLRVFEIFNLRLNADLVTLSACETGLGEQVTGEGMVGMTRAFLYAGARSLLVSLWPVSDRSTPDLMTGFYRHLEDSGSKAEALHRAKLERIEAGDEPYRWSPFILAGDPQ